MIHLGIMSICSYCYFLFYFCIFACIQTRNVLSQSQGSGLGPIKHFLNWLVSAILSQNRIFRRLSTINHYPPLQGREVCGHCLLLRVVITCNFNVLVTLMYLKCAPRTWKIQVWDWDSVSADTHYSMTWIGSGAQKKRIRRTSLIQTTWHAIGSGSHHKNVL